MSVAAKLRFERSFSYEAPLWFLHRWHTLVCFCFLGVIVVLIFSSSIRLLPLYHTPSSPPPRVNSYSGAFGPSLPNSPSLYRTLLP